MFLTRVSPVPYSDPWGTPFDQRRAELLQGSPRVAYYYDRPDNSTFRYRAYNMIQVLREIGTGVGAAFFHLQEIEPLSQLLDQIDVLVICRARYSDGLNRLISRARNKGKRVLFDIDDLVFDCAFVPQRLGRLLRERRQARSDLRAMRRCDQHERVPRLAPAGVERQGYCRGPQLPEPRADGDIGPHLQRQAGTRLRA